MKLTISNFMGIKSQTTELKNKVSVYLAPNGTGKSSFLQAYRYLLTGTEPAKDIINADADECSVSLEITNEGGSVTILARKKHRVNGASCYLNGKKVTKTSLDSVIQDVFETSIESLNILSSRKFYEALTPDKLGNYILTNINKSWSIQDIEDCVPDLTPIAKAVMEQLLPADGITLPHIENMYKQCYEERRVRNRDLKQKQTLFDSKKPRAVSQSAEELEKELKAAYEYEALKNNFNTLAMAYNNAIKNAKSYAEQLNMLQAKINENAATEVSADGRATIKAKIEEIRAKIDAYKNANAELKGQIGQLKVTLQAINEGGCPIAKGIVCTTDRTPYKQKLETWITSAETAIKENDEKVAEENKNLAAADQELQAFETNLRNWEVKKQLISQKESMEKNKPVLPERPQRPEIEKGREEAEIKADLAALKDVAESDALKQEIASLQKQIAALDFIVNVSGTKGALQTAMMSRYMAVLADVCNSITKQVRPATEFSLVAEDGVKVFFNNGTGFKPVASLSTGETAYVSFVMMNMIHQLSGAKVLLLDEASVMDSQAFAEILQLCLVFEAEYTNIIVAGVDHADMVEVAQNLDVKNLAA